jgi:arsenate reductase
MRTMIIVYGLKNCDTCRKALKALPDAVLHDVREQGVPDNIMAQAFAKFGDKLLNTRSTTWRGLDEVQRAHDPVVLIKAHPALMKRPLVEAGDTLFLGWSADTQAQIEAAV